MTSSAKELVQTFSNLYAVVKDGDEWKEVDALAESLFETALREAVENAERKMLITAVNMVDDARRQERERCAKIADEHCECDSHICLSDVIADEIRHPREETSHE